MEEQTYYFELFKELRNMQNVKINEGIFYDETFAEVYDACTCNIQKELKFYIDNCHPYNNTVLEIGCGSGRIMTQLAAHNFIMTGVELSKSMVKRLEERLKTESEEIQKLCSYEIANIFDYITDKKYGMIIIPATTICLLFENYDISLELLNKIYLWLDNGGRLVFDYRVYQNIDVAEKSDITFSNIEKNGMCKFWFFQEFNNYIKGKSIVNYYLEIIEGEKTNRYVCSVVKKIISTYMMEKLMANTKFKKIAMSTLNYTNNISTIYVAYEK